MTYRFISVLFYHVGTILMMNNGAVSACVKHLYGAETRTSVVIGDLQASGTIKFTKVQ
jgi:hypothetical protein